MRKKRSYFSLPSWLFISAAVVISGLALVTGTTINEREFQREVVSARLEAAEIADLIEERLTRYFEQLEIASLSLATIVANNPDIDEYEFRQIGERLVASLPEVINVAAAPGNVVRFVYPLQPNESVIGLDYREDPGALAVINRSRVTRSPQMQGPVSLVQGGEGFIVRTAVNTYDENLQIERYWGVIALVIEPDRLIDSIGFADDFGDWDVSIARVDADGQLGQMIIGTGEIFSDTAISSRVSELGTDWDIYVLPANGWPESPPNLGQTWTLVISTAFFLLLMLHTFMRLFIDRETAQRQLVQAIENLNDGFALYDQDDRLVLFNQRYKDLYSKSSDLLVEGAKFEHIIREGVARGQYSDAIGNEEEWIEKRLAAHERGNSEIDQLLSDGRWLRIAERKTPDGGTVGFRVDITELKKAIEQANEANMAKSEFLQVISHELRTPLTAVIGFLTFLAKPEVLPTARRVRNALQDGGAEQQDLAGLFAENQLEIADFAKRARSSSEHLMRLIADVLEWSKLEQHAVSLRVEQLASREFAASLVPQFEQLASTKGLKFTARIADFEFEADPDRLRQVLINLVGNATKFTERGEVILIAERSDGRAVFKVQDSGPGISRENQKKLFERFFQVDSSVTRNHGGVGLGLSISKYLVNLHRGEISVYSELGKGSEFVVDFPLRYRAETPQ